jgi:probable phosphoglycerate mutase
VSAHAAPATVWLARHGETTWNMAGRYQGRMESALSALGVRQGLALADHFFAELQAGRRVPARIVSSPMVRCAATAQFTADRLGIPVETDERLIEIAHGTWDGRYRDDLAREDPERYRAWRNAPESVSFDGGESLADVRERWRSFARELARETRDTLVCTHDAVVRCALVDLTARPLAAFWDVPVENAGYALLATDDAAGLVVRDACVTGHLASARADVAQQAL